MRKEREMKMKREEKKENGNKKKRKKREKTINLYIQTNRQTDERIDRHKSFIDMRNNTEQYSKSNSIKENRIE